MWLKLVKLVKLVDSFKFKYKLICWVKHGEAGF